MQHSRCKRDAFALQLPINRDAAAASANDENLRFSRRFFQLHKAVYRVIAAAGDLIQLLNIRVRKDFIRRAAFVNAVSPDAHHAV